MSREYNDSVIMAQIMSQNLAYDKIQALQHQLTRAKEKQEKGTDVTTNQELLSVKEAVDTMSSTLGRLNIANKKASDNQQKLSSLLSFIDKRTIKEIQITINCIDNRSTTCYIAAGDAIAAEKICSIIAETLANRINDAMNEVRELAAQLSA